MVEGGSSASSSRSGRRLVVSAERVFELAPHLTERDREIALALYDQQLGHVEPDADAGRAVAPRPSRVAELAVPVEKLEADQTRAFFSSGGLRVWSAQTGRMRAQRGDCENLVDLAIAGGRVAWVCEEQFLSSCAATLKTATLAQSRPVDVVKLIFKICK